MAKGRRPAYSREWTDRICRRICMGETLWQICGPKRRKGYPHYNTVYRWICRDDGFRRAYLMARRIQADRLFEEMLPIADGRDPEGAEGRSERRDQMRINTRKAMAAQFAPRFYGDRMAASGMDEDAEAPRMDATARAERIRAILEAARRERGGGDGAAADDPEAARALIERLDETDAALVDEIVVADVRQAVWRPLAGPQTEAFYSAADIVGYGGAAGGGKTDLLIGAALQHRRAIIFRREGPQLDAILDRMTEILGGRKNYYAERRVWHHAIGRQVAFGSAPNPGDERRFQGRAHDFIGFDEAANFTEGQVRFLLGWLRSSVKGQRCRAILAFNPPASAEGRWVIPFFAPWLDPAHPNPARPGELRWFAMVDGIEVETGPEPFAHGTEIIRPVSRTFIASRVEDNPFLMETGYLATLQAMPEPLRSQMLKGDFAAGMEDDPWQVIPTAWIEAAMARWTPREAKGPMDSMGVDVARGGRDEMVIARRHGTWFDQLITLPGAEAPDGPFVASQVVAARRDLAPVHIDVVGWGASPYDFLAANRIQTVPVNGAEKSAERSADDTVGFANRRAELWWRMREALDPAAPEPVALPPDAALKADLAAPRWSLTAAGVRVEGKEEMKKRLGRSPDRGDAVVMALMATPKQGSPARTRARGAGYVA